MWLQQWLDASARARPNHPAVEEAGGAAISYAELAALTDRARDRLVALGVKPGDRVGVYIPKTIDTLGAIFGALKAGAAYVPVDPTAPASRNGYIFANCAVRVVFAEASLVPGLQRELAVNGASPVVIPVEGCGGGGPLRAALDRLEKESPAPEARTHVPKADDLAYILYTSGSTGKPKGVMLSHENAKVFVDWCSDHLKPRADDRFSSHAPFHFDLSILDIYTPIKHGCTLVIVGEDLGKEPAPLAKYIEDKKITVWYSAPSILSLMAQFGNIPALGWKSLRTIIFAGEVFPVVHLRSLKNQAPHCEYWNLYGPTETNVCTYYLLPPGPVPESRAEPYPIGVRCEHYDEIVIDAEGREVARGVEGELCMAGPGVMGGYWGNDELTKNAFVTVNGRRWYKTGDIVALDPEGNWIYRGRRDRMIKKRGYRVELGEIEACLYQHPNVREAAIVAIPDESAGFMVWAHLSSRDGAKISLIALKKFCSERLPLYMIPDKFQFHDSLPKTSTDKTDYQRLKALSTT